MKLFNLRLFVTLLLFLYSWPAWAVDTNLDVGSRGLFFCKYNDIGFAQLFRTADQVELSLDQRIRVWTRNRNRLRNLPLEERRPNRVRELNRLINGGKSCRRLNAPANACSIFVSSNLIGQDPSNTRIISGSECIGDTSPIVFLDLYNEFDDPLGACTGTVVANRLIVTAAHCIADAGDGEVTEVDVYDLNGNFLTPANDLNFHDNYFASDGEADYDLAIVRTVDDLNTNHMPIHMVNDLQPTEIAAISGYGVDENDDAEILKGGFVRVHGSSDTAIRARFQPGSGSNTCFGDSGGPIAVFRNSEWHLVGATANGDNSTCGVNGRPDLSRWVNISAPENLAFLQTHAAELFD